MIFKIPVSWEVYSYVEVEAETPEEALRILNERESGEHPDGAFSLPSGDYVDGSFLADEECFFAMYNEEN